MPCATNYGSALARFRDVLVYENDMVSDKIINFHYDTNGNLRQRIAHSTFFSGNSPKYDLIERDSYQFGQYSCKVLVNRDNNTPIFFERNNRPYSLFYIF